MKKSRLGVRPKLTCGVRRVANRDRLRKGLENAEDPLPIEHVSQGSYAMRTMIQHDETTMI